MTKTALLLGASGKIARHFRPALRAAGWETRDYKRGTDMTAAAMGCDLIVNGMNPPNYHNWAEIIPAITTDVLAAAKASGATVIVPGNVYVYGNQPGPWSETTPHKPVSRKGRIRAEMEARYRKAAGEGVRTIMLHAGDFIGLGDDEDIMQYAYLRAIKSGKLTLLGPADVRRAHAFLPDLARAAVGLAEIRATLPAYCDVPFTGQTFSGAELKAEIERQTGRSLKTARFPWWIMSLAAPVWELAREMKEMRYLFETPHALDGKRLAELLPGFQPTPLSDVVSQTLTRFGVAQSGR